MKLENIKTNKDNIKNNIKNNINNNLIITTQGHYKTKTN